MSEYKCYSEIGKIEDTAQWKLVKINIELPT